MADMNSSMNSAAEYAERARMRAEADVARQAESMRERAAWHQRVADRASQAALYARDAAFAGGAHIYSHAARGAAYAYANAAEARGAGAFFGMSNFETAGPVSRGIPGTYVASGQSFGGLVYDAYLGDALSALSLFSHFRDSGQVLGMPLAMVKQRTREELSLRLQHVPNSMLTALPDFLGYRFEGLRTDAQRQAAYAFSHVTGPAATLAGGRGISSTNGLAKIVSDTMISVGTEFDKQRGYSLALEEERDIQAATYNLLSSTRKSEMANMSSSQVADDIRKTRRIVHRMIENLRITSKEAVALADEFGNVFSPEMINELVRATAAGVSGGSAGGMTPVQYAKMMQQHAFTGMRLGLSMPEAIQYGASMSNRQGGYINLYQKGIITGADLFMYGGNTVEEASALFLQAQQRMGLTYGAAPGMGAMFETDAGRRYMRSMAAGRMPGGIMGFLSQRAGAVVSDPYAEMRSLYNPQTRQEMAMFGDMASYEQATQAAEFATMRFPGQTPEQHAANKRAMAIRFYARQNGIQDPVIAAREYDLKGRLRETFGGGAQAVTYQIMQQRGSFNMSLGQYKDTVNKVLNSPEVAGDINKFAEMTPYEQEMLINRSREIDLSVSESQRQQAYDAAQNMGAGARIGFAVAGLGLLAGVIGQAVATGGVGILAAPPATKAGVLLLGTAIGAGIGAAASPDVMPDDAVLGASALGSADETFITSYFGNDSEDEQEALVRNLLNRGLTPDQINAGLRKHGVTDTYFEDSDLRDKARVDKSRLGLELGSDTKSERTRKALVKMYADIKNGKKIPDYMISGASREKASGEIRRLSGMSEEKFLDLPDTIKATGMRYDIVDGKKVAKISDAGVLLTDPEIKKQLLLAAQTSGNEADKQLVDLLKDSKVSAGSAITAFQNQASSEAKDTLQLLRGQMVASTLASSPRGHIATKPVYVEVVPTKDKNE